MDGADKSPDVSADEGLVEGPQYDEKNPTSIIDEVRKELGLELKRTKRLTEVLVVSTIEPGEKKN